MRPALNGGLLQLLAISLVSAQEPPRLSPHLRSQIATSVGEYMKAHHIPGLSLALGASDQVVLAEGFGQADLEHAVTVTPSTLFGLQSTQKLLTATAVLRLAETGRLRLTDPVQRYCPAFGVHRWPVTSWELLSHQGGVRPSELRDLFNRDHYASAEAALRRFARDSLQSPPGTQVIYSNAGYTLLACVIEGSTGQPYDSALAQQVLRPAGMRSTRVDNVFDVITERTRYYVVRTAANTDQWRDLWAARHLSSTRLDQPANADPVDPSWAVGAGNYLGTPTDLVRFALALMGGRLLSGSYRDSAFAEVNLTVSHQPTGRTLGGWLPGQEQGKVLRVMGSSWNGSFGLAIVPSTGVAVAIASNIEFDQPMDLVMRILDLWRTGTH